MKLQKVKSLYACIMWCTRHLAGLQSSTSCTNYRKCKQFFQTIFNFSSESIKITEAFIYFTLNNSYRNLNIFFSISVLLHKDFLYTRKNIYSQLCLQISRHNCPIRIRNQLNKRSLQGVNLSKLQIELPMLLITTE